MTTIIEGKLVEFKTKDELILNGFLHKTRKNNKTAIIFIHGMSGNFFGFKLINELYNKLEKTKYDIFSINTRGFGLITKFKKADGQRIQIGTAFEKFEECLIDIEAAIKTLQQLKYKEFILMGHSTGCQKITYYQAKKQNKKIKALILLAPADDYNLQKTSLGKKFEKAVNLAKKMVKDKKGNNQMLAYENKYSAKRYLSFANSKNNESQLFNYDGKLKLFSKIKEPVLAIFGELETPTNISPKQMLEKLAQKTSSTNFEAQLIEKADHGFKEKEKEVAEKIKQFL